MGKIPGLERTEMAEGLIYLAEGARDNSAAIAAGITALIIGGGIALNWAYSKLSRQGGVDINAVQHPTQHDLQSGRVGNTPRPTAPEVSYPEKTHHV